MNGQLPNGPAWLEASDGTVIPIRGACSIGRSSTNQVVLSSTKASRRHAIIQQQHEGEYWLVDFGSSNGTHVNARRCVQPVRLHDGDQLRLGEQGVTFRQDEFVETAPSPETTPVTIPVIETMRAWLLLADLENFTPMSVRLPQDELARAVGGWLSDCRDAVEAQGGQINKYLGDGFLAYWPESPLVVDRIHKIMDALAERRERSELKFRLAIHAGEISLGSTPSGGAANMMGSEVNFVFRMEKLAGSLHTPCLGSEYVAKEMSIFRSPTPVGTHPLKGFPLEYPFFSIAW